MSALINSIIDIGEILVAILIPLIIVKKQLSQRKKEREEMSRIFIRHYVAEAADWARTWETEYRNSIKAQISGPDKDLDLFMPVDQFNLSIDHIIQFLPHLKENQREPLVRYAEYQQLTNASAMRIQTDQFRLLSPQRKEQCIEGYILTASDFAERATALYEVMK